MFLEEESPLIVFPHSPCNSIQQVISKSGSDFEGVYCVRDFGFGLQS